MILVNILWPVFAMAALTFAVWIVMAVRRLGHVRDHPPGATTFATGDEMRRYFAPVELANDNLVNLLQMPVLFFVLALLLIVTMPFVPVLQVGLAWLYVLLRLAHSIIHIGIKAVRARFLVHVASNAVLSAMWLGWFIDMVAAAHAFSQAGVATAQP